MSATPWLSIRRKRSAAVRNLIASGFSLDDSAVKSLVMSCLSTSPLPLNRRKYSANTDGESGSSSSPAFSISSVISCPCFRLPLGAPSSARNTTTSPNDNLPSRLHRPAAWAMLSSPAIARYTQGKSKSTPASINCVLTSHKGLCRLPARYSAKYRRTNAMTSLRCVAHILADKCSLMPSEGRAAKSFWACFRVLTTAKTHGRAAISSAISCQLCVSTFGGGILMRTRRSFSDKVILSATISRTSGSPSKMVRPNASIFLPSSG